MKDEEGDALQRVADGEEVGEDERGGRVDRQEAEDPRESEQRVQHQHSAQTRPATNQHVQWGQARDTATSSSLKSMNSILLFYQVKPDETERLSRTFDSTGMFRRSHHDFDHHQKNKTVALKQTRVKIVDWNGGKNNLLQAPQ